MASRALPIAVKTFIVERLACFDTPKTVADAVNDEFGLVVSRQAVEKYDPTKRAGRELSKKYRVIFENVRKGFITETQNIGFAHRAIRLHAIQRVGNKALEMGNLPLVLQATEQAAKEMGNAFTNKREITGADGGPIETKEASVDASKLSTRALKELVAARASSDAEQ